MNDNLENKNLELFTLALGIKDPWKITKIELDDKLDLHIHINFKKGTKFSCKTCNKKCEVHDTKIKTWRHLNFFEHKTFIHARVPRVKCDEHKVHLLDVPWSNGHTGFTLLFEQLVMNLAKKMCISAVSKMIDEKYGKIWRIIKKYACMYIENIDCSNVTQFGLDETSIKGHNYITVFIDLKTSRVVYIANGKCSDNIEKFKDFFIKHGGDPNKVTDVTSDMSMGFTKGIKKAFPNSRIVYDKFHVIKIINEALDDVRKDESKKNKELKNSKYIWLKNKNNLTFKQSDKLTRLSKMNLKTGIAYRLKIAIQDIYSLNYSPEIAIGEFDEWISWALKSKLEPFKEAAKTIKSKMRGITNYFYSKLTNAVLEGTNSMIQTLKSRGRGYKNLENFKAMIYLMNSENRVVGQ